MLSSPSYSGLLAFRSLWGAISGEVLSALSGPFCRSLILLSLDGLSLAVGSHPCVAVPHVVSHPYDRAYQSANNELRSSATTAGTPFFPYFRTR